MYPLFILESELLVPKLPKLTRQNSFLDKFFYENRNAAVIRLSSRDLTDDDVTIVAHYAMEQMQVSSASCEQTAVLNIMSSTEGFGEKLSSDDYYV